MLKSFDVTSRLFAKFAAFFLILSLMGCAVGDPFDASKDKIPTLKPDMARIFVYRNFNPLALLRPLVFKLDGEYIADTYASTIFYHDIKPGKHLVNMGTKEDDVAFNVAKGETVYLRYSVVADVISKANFIAELIRPKIAESELGNVRLIKKELRFPDENK